MGFKSDEEKAQSQACEETSFTQITIFLVSPVQDDPLDGIDNRSFEAATSDNNNVINDDNNATNDNNNATNGNNNVTNVNNNATNGNNNATNVNNNATNVNNSLTDVNKKMTISPRLNYQVDHLVPPFSIPNDSSEEHGGLKGKMPLDEPENSKRPSSIRGLLESARTSVALLVPKDSFVRTAIQIVIPFLIAGIGTCGAGLLLDYVEAWKVFEDVPELFILVPTLLDMKGNIEMTLASRVSTQANLGELGTLSGMWNICWGNLCLVACQASVVGLLASVFAVVMSVVQDGLHVDHILMLFASTLVTALTATFVLGSVTLLVVCVSHRHNVDPDNVATPIAASLGDVTTLALFALVSSGIFRIEEHIAATSAIIAVILVLVPLWAFFAYKNTYVKQVLCYGWTPILIALIISSSGGYILEYALTNIEGFAVFQPVFNGVAGNLVAVQASRISTYFHRHGEKPGSRPPDGSPVCISPLAAYFGKGAHARTARILLSMVVPGHVLFGYAISFAKGGETTLTASPSTFLPIYLAAAFLQVALLLYTAQCLIHVLWRFKIDPDNSAIPLLTALGDLSGIFCLTAAFHLYDII